MRNQKKNKGGDFIFAMVPYEYDFVDGSNMLSVWGGCEEPAPPICRPCRAATPGTTRTSTSSCAMPASIMGDEAKRNTMYQQAEKILVEDVALVPIYHPIMVAMVKPDINGPMFAPDKNGVVTWMRHRFSSRESLIYRTTQPRQ